jgi:hypothetical protein
MNLDEMRLDSAIKQKKGLHFILASVIIWLAVFVIHLTPLPILTKNLLTFCFTAPLMPLAFMISKIIKVDFSNKANPLTNLGIIFSANQIVYLLIAMWIFNAVPEKMIMVLAMIFGAHLLPYGWLYKSNSYMILCIVIPLAALFVGQNFPPSFVAGLMIAFEMVFSLLLVIEVRKLPVIWKEA